LKSSLEISSELVDGCRNKVPAAQEAVYKATYVYFMKICLRYTGDYDEAANLLQDAFIKIFTKLNDFSGKGSFVGWMKRIVVNTTIDYLRKERVNMVVSINEDTDLADDTEDVETFVIDEADLIRHIRELPKLHLLVFNLYVMDENSHAEISEKLGISVASSKWYLHEARKILQKRLAIYINGDK
jgi:RNA polymerase sigma-70 factor (ECF subfamily)